MLFLKNWLIAFRRFLSRTYTPSEQAASAEAPAAFSFVCENGFVTRLVFSSREIYKATNLPKPLAFAPELHPDLQRYELSVCGRNGVSDERVAYLGRTIRESSGRKAHAAIDIAVSKLSKINLICEEAPETNYSEHAVILKWDSNPNDKSARLLQQQDLASTISLQDVRLYSA